MRRAQPQHGIFQDARAPAARRRACPPGCASIPTTLTGRVLALPTRQELELPFDEALVVEYYQR